MSSKILANLTILKIRYMCSLSIVTHKCEGFFQNWRGFYCMQVMTLKSANNAERFSEVDCIEGEVIFAFWGVGWINFLQDLNAKLGRDYPTKDMPAEVNATVKAGLDVMFLNSAVDATCKPYLCPVSITFLLLSSALWDLKSLPCQHDASQKIMNRKAEDQNLQNLAFRILDQ